MMDGGRCAAEETVWDEFRPRWMLERHEAHIAAELFEDMTLLHTFAIFAERDQIDGVIACEFAQEVKRALVGAAVDGVWDVGVDDEDFHGRDESVVRSRRMRIARK